MVSCLSCVQALSAVLHPAFVAQCMQRTLCASRCCSSSCCGSMVSQKSSKSTKCNDEKTALAILAPSFEEVELVTPVNVLRRGGVKVKIAGMKGDEPHSGLKCIGVQPDIDLDEVCGKFDAVILTGDQQAVRAMNECKRVKKLLCEQERRCSIIAAICCAPLVLKCYGIAKCKRLTSHPDVEKKMRDGGLYTYCCEDVVVDDYLITARGPAQALQWSLTILMHLTDERVACQVAKQLLVR